MRVGHDDEHKTERVEYVESETVTPARGVHSGEELVQTHPVGAVESH